MDTSLVEEKKAIIEAVSKGKRARYGKIEVVFNGLQIDVVTTGRERFNLSK